MKLSYYASKYLPNILTKRDKKYEKKELDKSIYSTIHHCSQVECSTGKLTLHDVDYCIDLIKRIMKHKFEYKPQNFES
jgi:hypothetical protein